MHLLILHRDAATFIWDWPKDSGHVFSGQMSPHFCLFLGKKECRILHAKDEKDHPNCYQQKLQKLMLCGYISPHDMGDLHICEGTTDAEAYVGILERYMLPWTWQLFPGTPCLFQQDIARPHSAQVTTAWLPRHRVRMLDWPASSPDLSLIECMAHHEEENQPTATTDLWVAQVFFECVAGINF